MEALAEIGPEELRRRWGRAERRIRENGITYNIYSDPLGANRPWKIDVVPFLIAADEWRLIETGIIQRAQVLSLVLEDLNIYSDPLGANRPWKIDVVPFLIAADEWRLIETGIIQRAQVLSLVLEDLYGSQSLVANGH